MIVSNPNRPLDKGVEMSKFEYYCQKIAPYLILACILILCVLIFIALVKYCKLWFITPQNSYEHLTQIVGCIL